MVALENARAHRAGDAAGAAVGKADLLRPDRDRHALGHEAVDRPAAIADGRPRPGPLGPHGSGHDVGLAEESGDEGAGRALIDLVRRAHLLGAPPVHHHDAVAERHRLGLVMGDENRRGADCALDLAQLDLHLLAQLGVKVGQRLVQQQDARAYHQRAGQRHALLLAARHAPGIAVGEGAEPHQVEGFPDPPVAFGPGNALHLQAEGDVLGGRHVREQSVALEHDAEAAAVRPDRQQIPALQARRAGGRIDEAGDHLQRSGLAAARRPEQRHQLALVDGERQRIDGEVLAEPLGQAVEFEEGHRPSGPGVPPRERTASRAACATISVPPRGSSAWSIPRGSG
jgi:hypothetical protein